MWSCCLGSGGRHPSGILTDVTHVDIDNPYFEEEDIEAALVRRAVPLSNYADPGVDGSLTLSKLASVLNLNETIKQIQLFSDDPSSNTHQIYSFYAIRCSKRF